MDSGLLPSRYAKALYDAATDKGVSDGVYVAMGHLESVFESSEGASLSTAVANPYLDNHAKENLIIAACGVETAPNGVKDLLVDFVKLLFQNHRVAIVRGVALSYLSLYRRKKHIRRVTVEWASTPDSATEERMKSLVQKHIGDDTMEYTSEVNGSLIGGYRIAIDNERLDASISNEFNQLRQKLLSK